MNINIIKIQLTCTLLLPLPCTLLLLLSVILLMSLKLHMSRLLPGRLMLHVRRLLLAVQHPKNMLLSLLRGLCALQVKT
jgi:hypothetical protein